MTERSTPKILFVDDDPNLLAALERQLRDRFTVMTAASPVEGLNLVRLAGPIPLVVADMRMGSSDGIAFLGEVEAIAPETVRILLTGFADLETAVQAINEGHIFRFLTKPCPPETLERALEAGLRQYHLTIAERELLEKTLVGSVRTLMEILSVVNPSAFGMASSLRQLVVYLAQELALPEVWQYELAAALSQIGWITFPRDLLAKVVARATLTEREAELVSRHPQVGRRLLENIPRLERIAAMIEGQNRPAGTFRLDHVESEAERAKLGAQLLHVAVDYQRALLNDGSPVMALRSIERDAHSYVPEMLAVLRTYVVGLGKAEARPTVNLKLDELHEGLILAEDVFDQRGDLAIPAGQELTYPLITYLFSLAQHIGYGRNTFKVLQP
jgi:ActR/RegA family two-component response regulator